MEYITPLYTYYEPLKDEQDMCEIFTFCATTKPEIIFIRLISGTLDFKTNDDCMSIENRNNYMELGIGYNTELKASVINNIIDCEERKIDLYIKKNRNNKSFFERILFETSNYFIRQKKEDYISAFVHLYRIVEHISFTFPLLYASKSNSYLNTFEDLKSFLNNGDKGELGFFKSFQEKVIENDALQLTFTMDLTQLDEKAQSIYNVFKKLGDENKVSYESISAEYIEIKYKFLFNLIITVRNRYFHMASTSRNVMNIDVDMNEFFKLVNDHILNWICYIYNHLLVHGVGLFGDE